MVDPAWIAEIAALEQAVPWIPTDDDMPNAIAATKRIHVERSDAMDSWWFGYGKDQGCCIEGTPCHWYWLAYILLGLAKESDAPYTEDAPLPYSPKKIAACLATVPKLVQTCRALAAALDGLRYQCGCMRGEETQSLDFDEADAALADYASGEFDVPEEE